MIKVSMVYKDAPAVFKTPLQQRTYETLEKLAIPFERVDTDEAVTMEDCLAINERLCTETVKTLFLCNRQQTVYYLFVTAGNKPFRSKDFSAALQVSRVSFAPAEQLSLQLGVCVGATTVFGLLLPQAASVQAVLDREVLSMPWYGCSDGTTTGYMRFPTSDLIDKLIPFTGHDYTIIDV